MESLNSSVPDGDKVAFSADIQGSDTANPPHHPGRGKTRSVNRFIGDSVYRKSKRRITERPKNRMAIDELIQDIGTGLVTVSSIPPPLPTQISIEPK